MCKESTSGWGGVGCGPGWGGQGEDNRVELGGWGGTVCVDIQKRIVEAHRVLLRLGSWTRFCSFITVSTLCICLGTHFCQHAVELSIIHSVHAYWSCAGSKGASETPLNAFYERVY